MRIPPPRPTARCCARSPCARAATTPAASTARCARTVASSPPGSRAAGPSSSICGIPLPGASSTSTSPGPAGAWPHRGRSPRCPTDARRSPASTGWAIAAAPASSSSRRAGSSSSTPTGAAVVPALGLLVTTNHAHGYVPTAAGEVMPGISVQVWRLANLALLRTVVLEAGPRGEENLGPLTPVAFHRTPVVYVNTHEGGGLYASDSLGQAEPVFRLVFDFAAGAGAAGAAVTPDDAYYVTALTGCNRVASFDVRDPWHPKLVSALRFDHDPADPLKARVGRPSALAMSADGTRFAVADDAVELPAERREGDHRVYLLLLDPATGKLRFDPAFRDETTGEVGVDFARSRWPHGETGPARPYGVLFVAPAPPPADRS